MRVEADELTATGQLNRNFLTRVLLLPGLWFNICRGSASCLRRRVPCQDN